MNHSDDRPVSLFKILRNLHLKETGIIPRIAVSLVSGLVLTAVALGSSWLIVFIESTKVGRFIRVNDDLLAVTFSVCGLIWLALLAWIWRGTQKSRFPTMALCGTLGLWLAVIFGCVVIDQAFRFAEEEYLMATLCLIAGAVTVLIWLPTVQRLRLGRPVVNSENLVNVTCPHCGYSLIGLRELRCPECGTQFAIDELIRRQNYGTASLSTHPSPRLAASSAVQTAEPAGEEVLPKT